MRTEFIVGMSRIYRVGEYQIICTINPEDSLSLDQQEAVLRALESAATEGFGHKVTSDSLRRHALADQDYLILVRIKGTLAGFAAAKDLSNVHKGVFLTGIVLSPECQGKGLGSKMFSILLETTGCRILAFTTQSPVMYLILKRVSKMVYPGVEGIPIPFELQEIGSQIMKDRRGEFCPTTFVSRDLYPRCLYPEFPWCSDSQVNLLFKQMLHFKDDKTRDGFLLVGEIR